MFMFLDTNHPQVAKVLFKATFWCEEKKTIKGLGQFTNIDLWKNLAHKRLHSMLMILKIKHPFMSKKYGFSIWWFDKGRIGGCYVWKRQNEADHVICGTTVHNPGSIFRWGHWGWKKLKHDWYMISCLIVSLDHWPELLPVKKANEEIKEDLR